MNWGFSWMTGAPAKLPNELDEAKLSMRSKQQNSDPSMKKSTLKDARVEVNNKKKQNTESSLRTEKSNISSTLMDKDLKNKQAQLSIELRSSEQHANEEKVDWEKSVDPESLTAQEDISKQKKLTIELLPKQQHAGEEKVDWESEGRMQNYQRNTNEIAEKNTIVQEKMNMSSTSIKSISEIYEGDDEDEIETFALLSTIETLKDQHAKDENEKRELESHIHSLEDHWKEEERKWESSLNTLKDLHQKERIELISSIEILKDRHEKEIKECVPKSTVNRLQLELENEKSEKQSRIKLLEDKCNTLRDVHATERIELISSMEALKDQHARDIKETVPKSVMNSLQDQFEEERRTYQMRILELEDQCRQTGCGWGMFGRQPAFSEA